MTGLDLGHAPSLLRFPQTTDDPNGSVSEAVAAAIKIVRESGLPHETTSMFTTLEGEWDDIMAVVKRCVDAVAQYSSRVSLVMKADIRAGYTGQLTAKVERVNSIIGDDDAQG